MLREGVGVALGAQAKMVKNGAKRGYPVFLPENPMLRLIRGKIFEEAGRGRPPPPLFRLRGETRLRPASSNI